MVLLRCAEGTRYAAALRIIATTGVRTGEALALEWDDVDREEAARQVRGTPARVGGRRVVTQSKTARSRRVLPRAPAEITLLGHADIRVTADVYGHVSDEVARAAMSALSRLLRVQSDPSGRGDRGRTACLAPGCPVWTCAGDRGRCLRAKTSGYA